MIFERWGNASGRYRLEARFRSQSLDEMRNLTPLGASAVQSLAFADCDNAGCDTAQLQAAVAPGSTALRYTKMAAPSDR